jgi:hypothetical protein
MTIDDELNQLDLNVDVKSLYREEVITDLKSASIRKLTPIKTDGSDDASRTAVFLGTTNLLTPQGPLPIQARLMANDFEEALKDFPNTMRKAVEQMVAEVKKMQQKEDSRIIVPGQS